MRDACDAARDPSVDAATRIAQLKAVIAAHAPASNSGVEPAVTNDHTIWRSFDTAALPEGTIAALEWKLARCKATHSRSPAKQSAAARP